jgi:hypothetical protein
VPWLAVCTRGLRRPHNGDAITRGGRQREGARRPSQERSSVSATSSLRISQQGAQPSAHLEQREPASSSTGNTRKYPHYRIDLRQYGPDGWYHHPRRSSRGGAQRGVREAGIARFKRSLDAMVTHRVARSAARTAFLARTEQPVPCRHRTHPMRLIVSGAMVRITRTWSRPPYHG